MEAAQGFLTLATYWSITIDLISRSGGCSVALQSRNHTFAKSHVVVQIARLKFGVAVETAKGAELFAKIKHAAARAVIEQTVGAHCSPSRV